MLNVFSGTHPNILGTRCWESAGKYEEIGLCVVQQTDRDGWKLRIVAKARTNAPVSSYGEVLNFIMAGIFQRTEYVTYDEA